MEVKKIKAMNKPEATAEIKERFIVQYWGQKILRHDDRVKAHQVCAIYQYSPKAKEDAWLELRSLKDITDEEAIDVAKILLRNKYTRKLPFDLSPVKRKDEHVVINVQADYFIYLYDNGHIDYGGFILYATNLLNAYQYLLSRGFLLPFNGYSCEEIIEMGWVRIKE